MEGSGFLSISELKTLFAHFNIDKTLKKMQFQSSGFEQEKEQKGGLIIKKKPTKDVMNC
jgi:hypothetical protein